MAEMPSSQTVSTKQHRIAQLSQQATKMAFKGRWVVRRKTATSRFARSLKAISQWCRQNRHEPVAQQRYALSQKLRGHFGYYGITGNASALSRFLLEAKRVWMKWCPAASGETR